jgi:hypothetical protein
LVTVERSSCFFFERVEQNLAFLAAKAQIAERALGDAGWQSDKID